MARSSTRNEVIREALQDSGRCRAVLGRICRLGCLGLPDGLLLRDPSDGKAPLRRGFLFSVLLPATAVHG